MTGDLIDALTELSGVTITVRHPLHAAAARLMDTLGVSVVVDSGAAPCERFLHAGHGRPWRHSTSPCEECRAVEERTA